jgi:hypothetical protein
LGALAFNQLWQCLAGDERLEVRRLLMRREGVFVLEYLLEEEFGRFRLWIMKARTPGSCCACGMKRRKIARIYALPKPTIREIKANYLHNFKLSAPSPTLIVE